MSRRRSMERIIRDGADVVRRSVSRPSSRLEKALADGLQETDAGCWVWKGEGARRKSPYIYVGQDGTGNVVVKTVRHILLAGLYGEIPAGDRHRPTCGNPFCQNPYHLEKSMNGSSASEASEDVTRAAKYELEIDELKAAMEDEGLTTAALAEKYRVSPDSIRRWINTKKEELAEEEEDWL